MSRLTRKQLLNMKEQRQAAELAIASAPEAAQRVIYDNAEGRKLLPEKYIATGEQIELFEELTEPNQIQDLTMEALEIKRFLNRIMLDSTLKEGDSEREFEKAAITSKSSGDLAALGINAAKAGIYQPQPISHEGTTVIYGVAEEETAKDAGNKRTRSSKKTA